MKKEKKHGERTIFFAIGFVFERERVFKQLLNIYLLIIIIVGIKWNGF